MASVVTAPARTAQDRARHDAAIRRMDHWLTAPECEPQRESSMAVLVAARAALGGAIREALAQGCPPIRVARVLDLGVAQIHIHADTPFGRKLAREREAQRREFAREIAKRAETPRART